MLNNKLILFSFCFWSSVVSLAQNKINGAQLEGQIASESLEISNNITLYQNPAIEYLMIDIEKSNLKNVDFTLTSMIGNKITITPELLGEGKYRISLDDYAAGYYFLVIRDEHTRFKKAYKFLIK